MAGSLLIVDAGLACPFSVFDPKQGLEPTPYDRDMTGLVAVDDVLRLIFRRVMNIAFDSSVRRDFPELFSQDASTL
jgi:hypothetical protein